MNIKIAIVELQQLFPRQSVNISVELWSSMYKGKRQPGLKPQWRIFVASETGLISGSISFQSEGATLETLIDMARQHVARQLEDKETLDGARKSIKDL